MDIPSYMNYVRDISVPVEQMEIIIRDVVVDIALSTKIFKKPFGFTISKDIVQYDFKSLFDLSVAFEYDVSNLSIGVVVDDNGNESLQTETTLVNNNFQHTLLSVDDIIAIYDLFQGIFVSPVGSIQNDKEFIVKSIFDYFTHITGFVYQLKSTSITNYNDSFDAIAIGSIIPDIDSISGDSERIIRPCVIAGVKYYVASNMMNQENLNTIGLLKNNFENEKLRLQNTFNTIDTKQIKKSWI